MEDEGETLGTTNSNNGSPKPKVVVIMGATGSGKSRLAIDLASYFPIEIVNADSMQVYQGLDILTNKVPLKDQKGVPHHLLGTISPNLEYTAKQFRNSCVSLIDGILSRGHLPVIVGGTNYYIQALVSPFLLDDSVEDMDESCSNDLDGDKQPGSELEIGREGFSCSYDFLKELDPVSANRIHPNDRRKISQYLSLYTRSGVPPSRLLQGKAMENWGRVDNFRYNCCFICVDASLPVIDNHVEQRVDCMVDLGLLSEVYDIYNFNADYSRGLRQAIGVREFEDFLRIYHSESQNDKYNDLTEATCILNSTRQGDQLKENLRALLNSSNENKLKLLLEDAISKVKTNTKRLVRRQKRRLKRLQILFGWNIHYVDATESLECASDDSWAAQVVQPSVGIIRSFLIDDERLLPDSEAGVGSPRMKSTCRDLWTRYVCKACGDRVLRGTHEWEQHKQGRSHRKRVSRLRKSGNFCFVE
ncbi:Adenylate dimethylallyltransferase [Bertholletia excelsa]